MAVGSAEIPETPAAERRSAPLWGAGSLVRAVARAPVGVRAKLLAGFGVIVLLLVVVTATGLLALRQSNSRIAQLRTEQDKARLVQAMYADAVILQTLMQQRRLFTVAPGTTGETRQPNSYYTTLDGAINLAYTQLDVDEDWDPASVTAFHYEQKLGSVGRSKTFLEIAYPRFERRLERKSAQWSLIWNRLESADGVGHGGSASRAVNQLGSTSNWFVARLGPIAQQAQERTNQLVADNNRSFAASRDLLLGVSGGSLALALALALLISWSLVVPLRKTGIRMSEIAAGDFTGHLDVPNRDEIGALASNVNQMSGELGRLYQELETASRHKSDFLATMSHELRTPLNAIIGFSEVLDEQMFGELNERQRAYVEDILAAGRHLLSLINDVLDLAKIEAGRMELDPSEVAIHELLRSATSMQAERAERAGIDLGLTIDPEEITVLADERRVRQVVFNLLSNAIKFTPAGGRVRVSARLDGGVVEVTVADTGPGIPTEDQEAIFEEFEQSPSSKGAEGTGLGLPLSRRLVELHGGRLWLESERGRGSTFRFTLPLEARD